MTTLLILTPAGHRVITTLGQEPLSLSDACDLSNGIADTIRPSLTVIANEGAIFGIGGCIAANPRIDLAETVRILNNDPARKAAA